MNTLTHIPFHTISIMQTHTHTNLTHTNIPLLTMLSQLPARWCHLARQGYSAPFACKNVHPNKLFKGSLHPKWFSPSKLWQMYILKQAYVFAQLGSPRTSPSVFPALPFTSSYLLLLWVHVLFSSYLLAPDDALPPSIFPRQRYSCHRERGR